MLEAHRPHPYARKNSRAQGQNKGSCKVSKISHLVGYIQRIVIWSQSDISLLLPIRPREEQKASVQRHTPPPTCSTFLLQ